MRARRPVGAQTDRGAQGGATSLGSVRITHAVKANGERLAPGTYTRAADRGRGQARSEGSDALTRALGGVSAGQQVKGREVVTIVPESDIAQVAEGKRVSAGSSRVEMLKGNDYVRVWINRGGNNYLIHLPPA